MGRRSPRGSRASSGTPGASLLPFVRPPFGSATEPAAPKETTSTPAGMLPAARLTAGSSALTTATQPGPWDAQNLGFRP